MPIVGLKGMLEFVPGAVPRPFAPKSVAPRPVAPKARVPFGPKPQTARNKLAKTLGKVRTKYLGGANRRNAAAIKKGIQARTPTAAPSAVVPSGTMGVPSPTESLFQALTVINECLLDLSETTPDAATGDSRYQNDCKRAFAAVTAEEKGKQHKRAGARALELGCVERAERHQQVVAAQVRLVNR